MTTVLAMHRRVVFVYFLIEVFPFGIFFLNSQFQLVLIVSETQTQHKGTKTGRFTGKEQRREVQSKTRCTGGEPSKRKKKKI